MNSNTDSYSMMSTMMMTARQPFLSALDYIFYIELHNEKEKIECNEEESLQSFRSYNTEIPKLNEILKKLGLDLQSAFDSFLIEFIENDGVYCLLDLLRLCLNRQQTPTNNRIPVSEQKDRSFRNKERHNHLKRALNDEYDCLLCLQFTAKRNSRTLQKMVSHKTGLSSLAACIVSNFTKSRLIALQLLSKVCDQTEGVDKVLEAMSTTRIIFGESVRFKFLVSMVNSGNSWSSNGIECNALSLLNTLLNKTGSYAERIRLQCELEEAGLDLQYLENILMSKNISKDEMIWTEIQRFRNQYIDVNEKFASKQKSFIEKHELKEEVEILHRALNKLEEDKINLMTIERELKEKCEDLEQEVDHLKTKFNVLIPVKSENRVISDNTNGDSGQWTDSDVDLNGFKHKSKKIREIERKIETKNDYNYDQNMKNEEEFIYVPAIHPPPNFVQYLESDNQINDITKQNPFYPSKRSIYEENNERPNLSRSQTQNISKQNKEINEKRFIPSDNKPLVVEVHPKPNLDEIRSGTDRDNYETILHWNYKTESESQKKPNQRNISSKKSFSMNQINAIKDNFKFKKDSQNISIYSVPQNYNNFSFDTHLKSFSNTSKPNLSQSNDCLYTRSQKKKNLKSSLQSYFFSGFSTLKQNKKFFQSIDSIEESQKSFPLPKTYRRNFIVKGHSNCGLFSGDLNDKSSHKNLSDDLKSAPQFDHLSTLVHKEIADATKDISGWL